MPSFIRILKMGALFFLVCSCQNNNKNTAEAFVYTVNGKIKAAHLNFSLTHEHVMSNFGGEPRQVASYNRDSLFRQVIPYLRGIKKQGVYTIFDCTASYFGRNVELLKALADSTGMQLITNTGFYGAANDKYVPAFAFTAAAEDIAKVWVDEFENGIDKTQIRPGFIKLAFDAGSPSDIDLKLFEAGILTHLKTGLTLVVHTGNNPEAAAQQLRLLEQHNVSASAWVWTHAHQVSDQRSLIDAAKKGAWISLDGVTDLNVDEYVEKIGAFKKLYLLDRILLSHDGNSFPRGRAIRRFDAIPTLLIPKLKQLGYSTEDVNRLMIKNPSEAFGIKVRHVIPPEKE